MKVTVHKDDDALYLRLDDTPIIESEEVSDGIILENCLTTACTGTARRSVR